MKVVSLHIIVFLLLISAHVAGKNIRYEPPKWISENYRKEMFPSSRYFVQFESYKNIRRKDRELKEKELIALLQEKISKQIQSFISTESVLFQSESDEYGYNELFVKETRIVSDVILFDSEPTVWYDKRDRRLFAMYAVEKKDLGEKYITLLTGKLTSLSKELENYNATPNAWILQRDLKSFMQRTEKLERLKSVIIASQITPSDEIYSLFSKVRSQIKELDKLLHSAETEGKIRSAQEFLTNGDFEDALKAFRMLSLDLPNDIRIQRGITESKNSIEQYYLYRINRYINRQQYDEALQLFDRLFKLLPEVRERHMQELSMLENKMFDFLIAKLDEALETKEIPEIKIAFSGLKTFRFVNPGKYSRCKIKVDRAVAEDYYNRAKAKYNAKDYQEAIVTINKAISIDGGNNQFMSLYNSAREKIYRQKLKELKLTQTHMMMFQFGAGVQTQKSLVDELVEDIESSVRLIPSYSLGLYAKYGIRPNVTSYGRDMSKSNIIGFQYTFVSPKYQYSFDEKFIKTSLSYWQEFEVVVGFGTKYLIKTGIANNKLSTSMSLKSVNFYTVSILRRFYTHPLELTFQFKTYVTSDFDFYPVFKVGIYFDVNMIRKVSHSEKKRIKQEVDMIK
jgi:tetratricopeptide (TPR) repeat protein